jgi:hypothetical protein
MNDMRKLLIYVYNMTLADRRNVVLRVLYKVQITPISLEHKVSCKETRDVCGS